MNTRLVNVRIKSWLKDVLDLKVVDMDENSWLAVDSCHVPYEIFINYSSMVMSVQMLSGTMLHNTWYYYITDSTIKRM